VNGHGPARQVKRETVRSIEAEMILTDEIHQFREVARHLWNTYLKRDADWDSVDTFDEICKKLFEEQITLRLELSASPIPVDTPKNPLDEYRLVAPHTGKLPLLINREIPASGYWDYPVEWIPPEEHPDIRPMPFFDFDLLGWRKLEFYQARIINCPSNPELNGRDALIRCENVEIEFIAKDDRTNGDSGQCRTAPRPLCE
jgi:hypothetical protein